jgi:hypothetical protein
MIAETYLLQALQAGFDSIRNDPSQLASVLFALNDQELAAATQWFSDANNVVVVAPGFPMETSVLPFIGVTIAEETQIEGQTPIGLDYYTVDNGDGTVTETRGTRFTGSLKATIYSPDANLVVWISAVAKWAIIAQFDWLGEQGFNNINVGLGDFEPAPGFLPVFTFNRGLFVRAEYDFIFLKVPTITPITSITIDARYEAVDFNTGPISLWGGKS